MMISCGQEEDTSDADLASQVRSLNLEIAGLKNELAQLRAEVEGLPLNTTGEPDADADADQ